MFLHQALPKGSSPSQKPLYSIKKSSLRGRAEATSNNPPTPLKLKLPSQSFQRSRSHSMKSTEKPSINLTERSHLPLPKHISSLCLQRNGTQRAGSMEKLNNTATFSNTHQRQSFEDYETSQPLFILCKIENKAVKSSSSPFQYNDLSQIDRAYYLCYEGQTKGQRIRHGFGTQWYSNGQKFVGMFEEDKASGQGTYYGVRKIVMGNWQGDCLRQIFIEM